MVAFGDGKTGEFGNNNTTTTTTATPFNSGPASASDFYDLVSSMSGTDSLSADAQNYLEKLGKMINPESSPKIDIRPCSGQIPAMTYILGKFAMVIAFAESMTRNVNGFPLSVDYFPKIQDAFARNFGNDNINLLNIVLVTKDDYDNRHQPMAGYIRATLEIANNNDAFQTFDFLRGSEGHFVCYTDLTSVRDMHNRWNPHQVMDRCDFGFILGIRKNGAYGQNQSEMPIPIAVVTGYNEFRLTQGAGFPGAMGPMMGSMNGMMMPTMKFNQLVHISSILCRIPSRRLLMSLIIPAAHHVFIQQGLCRQKYMTLGQGPDLCSLVHDANTGQPYRAESPEQVAAFLATMCCNPVLVVDVMDGRARIPGLEALAKPDKHVRVIDDLSSFLNVQFPQIPVGTTISAECGGTVRIRGNNEDIRSVDYFQVLEANKELATSRFLNRPQHATARFNDIRDLHQNGESLYYGLHVLMGDTFMNTLMSVVSPQLKLVTDVTNSAAGFMDTSILTSQAAGYGNITGSFASPMSNMGGGLFGLPNTGFGNNNGGSLF